jgi:hypothetical protein
MAAAHPSAAASNRAPVARHASNRCMGIHARSSFAGHSWSRAISVTPTTDWSAKSGAVAASVLGGRERLTGAPAVVCSPRPPPDASGDSARRNANANATRRPSDNLEALCRRFATPKFPTIGARRARAAAAGGASLFRSTTQRVRPEAVPAEPLARVGSLRRPILNTPHSTGGRYRTHGPIYWSRLPPLPPRGHEALPQRRQVHEP